MEWRQKLSQAAKQRAKDPKVRAMLSRISREAWARGVYNNEEIRRKKSEAAKRTWQDPARYRKGVVFMVERWRDPEYRRTMTEMSRRMWTPERREEWAIEKTGEGNPNWNGGSSFEPYPAEFNEALKSTIRERDGFACAICRLQETAQAHDVHHIDYDRTNNHPNNLITICHDCHPMTNGSRQAWGKRLTHIMRRRRLVT